MKKHFILSVLLMFSFLMSAQETVTLKFTSNYRNGSNMPFDYVIVKDITHNWLELLSAPDTIIVLTAYDGIDELDIKGGLLSEAFPNPFSGITNLMYSLDKPQQTKAQLFSFNGHLISEFEGSLDAGTYMFTIEMDRPQMAFFIVTSGNNKCYKKVLNIGAGNNNKIEVNKIVGNNQSRDVRVGDFVIGDLMEYEAVVYDNGNDISRVITQNQYGDEIISFTFDLNVPTVTTYAVGNISQTTGMSGGIVTSNGGSIVTERGICWSTNHNPTINDNHANNGSGNGDYIITMTNLVPGTTYYVRAYAINSVGIAYGNEVSFTTSQNNTAPTVTTNQVTDITQTTAVSGGNVTSDGGAAVTARGICWSTNHNPTTSGNHTTNGTGTGSFTANITGLTANTTYYVRAYATNSVGTSYGSEVSFTTESEQIWPNGVLPGLFSVSSTQQVYFSQGNLQYQASTNTWRFADNQYDCICNDNSHISSTYNGWIDLFGWSTSGYNHGAVCYQPWSTSQSNSDYYAYGGVTYNLYDQTGKADWGYNAISNGGNVENMWRTLTMNEWGYVLLSRNTNSGIRFAKAQVNGINGVIILPDNWSSGTYSLNNTNMIDASYTSNIINATNWNSLEVAGAVFFPAAGFRYGLTVNVSGLGAYWSSGGNVTSTIAPCFSFYDNNLVATDGDNRRNGLSVRLVLCESVNTPIVTTNNITNITQTTATGGGSVTSSGSTAVTARGICWSTNPNPTISGNHTSNGAGTGSFMADITGLTANTTYYVRAYATNSVGTSYGDEVCFTTLANQPQVPTGAINGLFSVSATQQVYFSQGNLQYKASTNTWRFATNQWDYVGQNNANISQTYNDWIDLFGWGTSGFNHGAVCYQPWSISSNYSDYYAYGSYTYNLYDQSGQADWGYNTISNGGNTINQWRTMTDEEWQYLFNYRYTTSGIRYVKANVNNIDGVILLPDNWNNSGYNFNSTNSNTAGFSSNTITASQWVALENDGAVFLPVAGYRYGASVSLSFTTAYYWSSSHPDGYYANQNACVVMFNNGDLHADGSSTRRDSGFSVRLVQNAQ